MLYTHLSLFFFSVSFSSVYSACFYFFPSVYLIFMKIFYIKQNKNQKKKSHSVSSSFDRLFISKNMNLYEGVGLWTVCVCVCGRSQFFFFLFSWIDCFHNQHQFLPSIIYLFVFLNFETHVYTLYWHFCFVDA